MKVETTFMHQEALGESRAERCQRSVVVQLAFVFLLVSALFCAIAVCAVPATALAEDESASAVADPASEGNALATSAEQPTLTLELHYTDGSKTVNVDGVHMAAYQVAGIGASGAYELLDEYASVDVDLNGNDLTAEKMLAAAASMSPIAEKSGAGVEATSDTDGMVRFGELSNGVYLVVQTGAEGTAKEYTEYVPFLINVPQFQTEGTVFDVVAKPKPPVKIEPPSSTSTSSSSTSTSSSSTTRSSVASPKTGDTLDMNMLIGFGIIGAMAMAVAIVAAGKLRRRKGE